MIARVILYERRGCPFMGHHLRKVLELDGCTYQLCECGTRRVVVEADGAPDAHWLRTGQFAAGQLSVLSPPQNT